MTQYRIALTTCSTPESAAVLARALVERQLAACVNIIPGLRSIYQWEDKIQDEAEALLVIKTDAAHVAALEEAVQELHGYDTPELIVLGVEAGSQPYLDWITQGLR